MIKMILMGGLGLLIGYKLNEHANKISEKKIIDTLTAQIKELSDKLQSGRIIGDEQGKIDGLQEALRILTNKK